MNTNELQLLLYLGTGSQTISLAEFLSQHKNNSSCQPNTVFVSLLLIAEGQSVWSEGYPVGDLARTAWQFRAASARLAQNLPALVRIGVDDEPEGGYFCFEPNANEVSLSFLHVIDSTLCYRYPVDEKGHAVTDVYDRILAIKNTAKTAATQRLNFIQGARFPRNALVAALIREAHLADQFFYETGATYYLELY